MPSPALIKLRNAGWLLLERGVGVLIAFFVMTLVARHLGPAGFGAYAYMLGLVAMVMPLAQAGLETLVMRDVAGKGGETGLSLGSAMVIHLAGGLLALGLAAGFVALAGGPEGVTPALTLLAGLPLLALPAEPLNAWFKARERMAWVVLPRIAVALGVAGLALALVHEGAGLGPFIALRGAEGLLLGVVAALGFAVGARGAGRLRVARPRVLDLLREGWPLMLSAIATVIYMRIDQVMLGQMRPEAELGQYSLATRVAEVALIVPVALRTSFFASIIRAWERGPAVFAHHAQLSCDAVLLATLGTIALGGGLSWLLFVPVFGPAFAPGLPMVLVLLLAVPWAALGTVRSAFLVAQGWLWSAPLTTALGALTNVVLNLVLIPHFGGMGAAWATVAAYALAAWGSCFLVPHLRPVGWILTRSLNPVAAIHRLIRRHEGAPR